MTDFTRRNKCYICGNSVPGFEPHANGSAEIQCRVCGPYTIRERAALSISSGGLEDSHIYSAAVRERNEKGFRVVIDDFEGLRNSVVVPVGPLERMDRIILYVFAKMDTDDAVVSLTPDDDYSVAYAQTPAEFAFLKGRAVTIGYLEPANGEFQYRLTLKGWEHAANLKQPHSHANQAFVAMSFADELFAIYQNAMKPALEQTGYIPLRVDQTHYNEKIDDRIIADIRKSGLLIADFTGHSGGVYFEAGLGLGLGIPVIWTCRKSDIEAAHFDTRQYNHIVWTDAEDLKVQLIARIEATVPLKVEQRRLREIR